MRRGRHATATLDVPPGTPLTREQAEVIHAQGQEAVVFVVLIQAKPIALMQVQAASTSYGTPSTPSDI